MSVIYRAFTGFAALAAAAASSSLDAASFASVGGRVAGEKKDPECCEVCRCGERAAQGLEGSGAGEAAVGVELTVEGTVELAVELSVS